MIGHFQVGRFLEPVDQQFGRPGHRQGKEPLAIAIQFFVDEVAPAPLAQEYPQTTACRDILLQRLDRRAVQPVDVGQIDCLEGFQRVDVQVAGRLDPRVDPRAGWAARGQRNAQESGVQRAGVAVDDQYRNVHRKIDHAIAKVVRRDRVAFEPGGDSVLTRRGEPNEEPLLDRLARRDLGDFDRGSGVAVFLQDYRDVLGRRLAEVPNRDFHEQRHARRPGTRRGRQGRDCQVRPHPVHAVDQVDLGLAFVEVLQLAAQIGRIVPLPGAEIGNHVDDPVFPVRPAVRLAEQLVDRLDRFDRSGGRFGNLQRLHHVLEPLGEVEIDRLFQHLGLRAAPKPAGAGETQHGERLALRLAGGLVADPLDDLFGLVHRAGVAPAIGHRETIVQQHDVVRLAAAEKVAQLALQMRLGHRQHQRGHGRHPQKQQQELFQDHPGAVLLLACQEELHGRPVDAPVPQQVDQVDQHGRAYNQQAPEQRRVEESRHEPRVPFVRSRKRLLKSVDVFPIGCLEKRPVRR